MFPAFLFTPATIRDPIILQNGLILADDGQAQDFLGEGVALSADGNTMAVGAVGDDDVTSGGGAVYIFLRSGSPKAWVQQAKIVVPVSQAISFGTTVSLSDDGNTLAVGHADTGGGTQRGVWVYTRSGSIWTLEQTVNPSVTSAQFGVSVSLSSDGDTLVVGAPNQTFNAASLAGAVFVFDRVAGVWTETIRTGRTGAVASEALGTKVAISGDGNTLVATHSINTSSKRAVVFALSGTWAQEAALAGGSAGAGPTVAIATDGATIVTTESNYDLPQSDCGRLEVWTRSGVAWSLIATPQSATPVANEAIGFTGLRMSGDAQYILATRVADSGAPLYEVVLFRKNGSTYTEIFHSASIGGVADDSRHPAIARDGKTFANGSTTDDNARGTNAGSVAIYTTEDNL